MIEIKAPDSRTAVVEYQIMRPRIFLAGSIAMGMAEPWQDEIVAILRNTDALIFNPRRDDWDSSWKQDISDERFAEQVRWELTHLELADKVFVYFDPNTQAPITLLELGRQAEQGNVAAVCCPDGFWRKGNVQIICDVYGIKLLENKEDFYAEIKRQCS